jgi:hypothetical protein
MGGWRFSQQRANHGTVIERYRTDDEWGWSRSIGVYVDSSCSYKPASPRQCDGLQVITSAAATFAAERLHRKERIATDTSTTAQNRHATVIGTVERGLQQWRWHDLTGYLFVDDQTNTS